MHVFISMNYVSMYVISSYISMKHIIICSLGLTFWMETHWDEYIYSMENHICFFESNYLILDIDTYDSCETACRNMHVLEGKKKKKNFVRESLRFKWRLTTRSQVVQFLWLCMETWSRYEKRNGKTYIKALSVLLFANFNALPLSVHKNGVFSPSNENVISRWYVGVSSPAYAVTKFYI